MPMKPSSITFAKPLRTHRHQIALLRIRSSRGRKTSIAVAICQRLALPEDQVTLVRRAALLHDIGKTQRT